MQWRITIIFPKQIVKYGYGRLDSIIEEVKRNRAKRLSARIKPILIAPSWGENAAIESGVAEVLIGKLIEQNFHDLRPHLQTLKFYKKLIDQIIKKYHGSSLFSYESEMLGQETLHESDIMISDFSG